MTPEVRTAIDQTIESITAQSPKWSMRYSQFATMVMIEWRASTSLSLRSVKPRRITGNGAYQITAT